jgi:hypothetical protein
MAFLIINSLRLCMFCPVFPLAQQVLLCKYRIDLLVKLEPDHELATYTWILIHDLFELFAISEDHGGIFVEVVFETGQTIIRNHSGFIEIFSNFTVFSHCGVIIIYIFIIPKILRIMIGPWIYKKERLFSNSELNS